MTFLSTFRGRLVVILAILLVATLGVQYYLNLWTQRENDALREVQEQTIVAGFALGISSVTSPDRVQDLMNEEGQTFLDSQAKQRIKDIIVIDDKWRIMDCLSPENLPVSIEGGGIRYRNLSDLKDLPPLMQGNRLGAEIAHFPNRQTAENKDADDEAHAIPIETSNGRWYVMVLVRNDRNAAADRAAQPLKYTLAIVLVSSLITFLLVFRFTRPIAYLSQAARRVAGGDLQVRVPENHRDELGRLGANFNEMTVELEKKRGLEAQLQQAEKSAVVGRLGSAIAHEIRNPLNYINLTLDHLRSKFAPDDAAKKEKFDKLTSQLKFEVARINQQITDFLNYSTPKTAKVVALSPREALEQSLRLIEPQAAEKHVTISVIEHEGVPQILGDPEFLRALFNNLFINGIHSMEAEGGHLNIKITPDEGGKFVNFEVADTGTGIEPENIEKIFEPYFSTKETGTGLGLAIVHKVVEIHHGEIDVESTPGTGTKFTVKLPRTEV